MRVCVSLMCLLLTVSAASGQGTGTIAAGHAVEGMGFFPASAIQWREGPATLRKGAKMALLEGDPSKEGVFTMRLWFPDGFVVSPHVHTQIEHVTIISGTLNFGMGEKFDRSATRPMPPGSFGYWPIGMKHFAYTTGDTVLQLHGRGPWTVTYLNPADDPRNGGQ